MKEAMSTEQTESSSVFKKLTDSRLFAGLVGLVAGLFIDNAMFGLILLLLAGAVFYYFSRNKEDLEEDATK